jgi:hypothetical protein
MAPAIARRSRKRLLQLGVPFVVDATDEPPPAWHALGIAYPDRIVAAVMHLIQTPEIP